MTGIFLERHQPSEEMLMYVFRRFSHECPLSETDRQTCFLVSIGLTQSD